MTIHDDSNDLTTLTSGSESDVYALIVGDQPAILKARHDDGRQQYLFEAFATQQASAQGALVPDVLYADDDLLLLSKLAGAEMDDRPALFTDVPLFDSITADLTAFHDIKIAGYGPVSEQNGAFCGTYASWQGFLATSQSLLNTLEPVGILDKVDIQALKQFWDQWAPSISLPEASLVHGDFAMSAIFVNENKQYMGMIDFGDAFAGDPLMDIAYFRYKEITKPYGADLYHHLRTAYVGVARRAWSKQDEQAVLLYMVYWGVQRLSHCPDVSLLPKFGDKLHLVAKLIKEQ